MSKSAVTSCQDGLTPCKNDLKSCGKTRRTHKIFSKKHIFYTETGRKILKKEYFRKKIEKQVYYKILLIDILRYIIDLR